MHMKLEHLYLATEIITYSKTEHIHKLRSVCVYKLALASKFLEPVTRSTGGIGKKWCLRLLVYLTRKSILFRTTWSCTTKKYHDQALRPCRADQRRCRPGTRSAESGLPTMFRLWTGLGDYVAGCYCYHSRSKPSRLSDFPRCRTVGIR